MTDIRVKEIISLEAVTMDWLLRVDGTLDEREELASSIRVALGTDRLSDQGEILPDPDSTDRRGWWGDMDAKEIWEGWPIGCKNWLLLRAKITDTPSMEGSTLQRAHDYTEDALQPFIDRRAASTMDVWATRTETERIEVNAVISRGPLDEIALRFQILWEGENLIAFDDPDAPALLPPPPIWLVPARANLTLSTTAPNRVP